MRGREKKEAELGHEREGVRMQERKTPLRSLTPNSPSPRFPSSKFLPPPPRSLSLTSPAPKISTSASISEVSATKISVSKVSICKVSACTSKVSLSLTRPAPRSLSPPPSLRSLPPRSPSSKFLPPPSRSLSEVLLLVPYYNSPNILPCTDGALWGDGDSEKSLLLSSLSPQEDLWKYGTYKVEIGTWN